MVFEVSYTESYGGVFEVEASNPEEAVERFEERMANDIVFSDWVSRKVEALGSKTEALAE